MAKKKKPNKILVKAAPLKDPGLKGKARVVKEGTLRRYITEKEPTEVEITPYYVRKIMNGELIVVNRKEEIEGPTLPKGKESSK